MSTNRNSWALSSVHQHRSIPSHPGTVGSFDFFIAWESWLVLWRNGVDVIGGWYQWHVKLQFM